MCGKHWLGSEQHGKWVYGDLIHASRCTISNNSNMMQYFVDEETVGQYTGLKDKNGKEIYEGDILLFTSKSGEKSLCHVLFENAAFIVKWVEREYFRTDLDWWNVKSDVVGNVYENPELLESERI